MYQGRRKVFRSGEAVGVGEAHIPLGGSGGMSPWENCEFYIA